MCHVGEKDDSWPATKIVIISDLLYGNGDQGDVVALANGWLFFVVFVFVFVFFCFLLAGLRIEWSGVIVLLCSWIRHFTLTVPLFTQEYNNGKLC